MHIQYTFVFVENDKLCIRRPVAKYNAHFRHIVIEFALITHSPVTEKKTGNKYLMSKNNIYYIHA